MVRVIVSMDSFDPVTDNAEMPGDMEGGTAMVLTHLGAIGNTKGIAIATAALAATALFGSFGTSAESALIRRTRPTPAALLDGAKKQNLRPC